MLFDSVYMPLKEFTPGLPRPISKPCLARFCLATLSPLTQIVSVFSWNKLSSHVFATAKPPSLIFPRPWQNNYCGFAATAVRGIGSCDGVILFVFGGRKKAVPTRPYLLGKCGKCLTVCLGALSANPRCQLFWCGWAFWQGLHWGMAPFMLLKVAD